jgi:hypothetical protein
MKRAVRWLFWQQAVPVCFMCGLEDCEAKHRVVAGYGVVRRLRALWRPLAGSLWLWRLLTWVEQSG